MVMEIHPGIKIIDLALYLPKQKIVCFSDFHIGYEESLARKGVLVPRQQYKITIDKLEQIFAKIEADTVVINGDLKHEFGRVTRQEWKEVSRLLDYLARKVKKIVVIKGNHDPGLGPLTSKRDLEVVNDYKVDDILFIHGDVIPEKTAKILIMGHEHPAITLQKDARREKYKCFIKGKFKKSVLIVQPSFNILTIGTDVTSEDLLSPLLEKGTSNFEVWIHAEDKKEALYFGKVKKL